MNRRRAIKAVVLGTAAGAVGAPAAASKDVEIFSARWEKAKVFTLQVADAMPEDGYAFKPKDEMRSYGELMKHLATNNGFYISRFKGDFPDSLKPPKENDKETVKKYMAASFDYCAEVIKGLTNEDLDKSYPGRPNTPPQTGWDWILHAFIHTAHHRGYGEVYLREKNIVPPRYSV